MLYQPSTLMKQRKFRKKNGPSTIKTKVVIDYNKGKSSVDLCDQMASYLSPLRKTVKWYRKVAVELLTSTSMVNTHILYWKKTLA